jgi:hypothetical protein
VSRGRLAPSRSGELTNQPWGEEKKSCVQLPM